MIRIEGSDFENFIFKITAKNKLPVHILFEKCKHETMIRL